LLVVNISSEKVTTPELPFRRRGREQKTLRPGSTHQVSINRKVNVNNTSFGWKGVTNGQLETYAVKGSGEWFGLEAIRKETARAG